jgi:hypothetical protein
MWRAFRPGGDVSRPKLSRQQVRAAEWSATEMDEGPPEGNDLRDQVRNLVKEDGICIKRFSCEIGADLLLRLASTTNHPHR